MTMIFAFSRTADLGASLVAAAEVLCPGLDLSSGAFRSVIVPGFLAEMKGPIALTTPPPSRDLLLQSFSSVSRLLGEALDDGSSQVEVWIDEVVPCALLIREAFRWETLIAMLILAFPEVRWRFGFASGDLLCEGGGAHGGQANHPAHVADFGGVHGLVGYGEDQSTNLFDGIGIRAWVKSNLADHASLGREFAYVPRRTRLAVAVDDEIAYCWLHAYAAYRFGYRAIAVSDQLTAETVLSKDRRFWYGSPSLTFEDVYISFAFGTQGMSDLARSRSQSWGRLEEADHRVFVTSQLRISGDDERWEDNQAYITAERQQGRLISIVPKPHAGIFKLWHDAGLRNHHSGYAPGFDWPPRRDLLSETEHDHSSPGILLLIAEQLVERARRLFAHVRSLSDSVRGAVLANEALELLGGRTPTISLEALNLKHQFEVLAECRFSGVQYHIDVHYRINEIKRDVAAISRWFGPRVEEMACLNGEMHILNNLVQIFRAHGQFDEAERLMCRVRAIHNSLWMRDRPLRLLLWPLLRYSEFLLASFSGFVYSLLGWLLLFTLIFALRHHVVDTVAVSNGPFSMALSYFSSSNPLPAGWAGGVAATAVLLGLAHLGIFVSHLYSMVARKI